VSTPPTRATTFSERLARGITRLGAADREALLDFRSKMLGLAAMQATPEYFRWQFEDNPHLGGQAPQVWIFRFNGEIIAQQANIPVRIKVAQDTYDGAWGVDLIVRPDWQQRGVGSLIALEASRGCKVAIGVSVSNQAAKAIQRLGWSELAMVPIYLRPLRLGDVLALALSMPSIRSAGSIPGRLLGAIDRSVLEIALRLPRIEVERIAHFDERADDLWRSVAPHYNVICTRDRETLEWRFARHPISGRYAMYYVKRRGRPIGYVVIRMGTWQSMSCAFIVDYLCAPEHVVFVLSAALREAQKSGAAIAACTNLSASAERAFRMLGFIRRQSQCRMMLRTTGVDDRDARVLEDKESWFVTAGDSDLDRPRPWEEEIAGS
jgi:GNAT superfamily N-acetyltransferase